MFSLPGKFWEKIVKLLKFIYSEKATKFCEIFSLILSYVVQSKVRWRFHKILWPPQNIWTLQWVPCPCSPLINDHFYKKLSLYIQIPSIYLGFKFKFGPSCVRSPCIVQFHWVRIRRKKKWLCIITKVLTTFFWLRKWKMKKFCQIREIIWWIW